MGMSVMTQQYRERLNEAAGKGNAAESLQLDHYDSVRSHVQGRLEEEVRQLEARILALRQTPTPHSAIIIATYERMIDRKRGFMRRWGMGERRWRQPAEMLETLS